MQGEGGGDGGNECGKRRLYVGPVAAVALDTVRAAVMAMLE